MSHCAKKIKTCSEWQAVITSTGPFASVAKAVKGVATNVTLEIVKTTDPVTKEEKEGIDIQVMDSGQVCMYAAHVQCEVLCEKAENDADFRASLTVNADLLDTVVSASNQPAYMLKFFPVDNNTKIEFHVRENVGADGNTSGTGYSSKMTLSTRNSDTAHSSLRNWKTDYAAFMSTTALKTFLKRAQKFQAERIRISIYTRKDHESNQFIVCLSAKDNSQGCEIVDTYTSQQPTNEDSEVDSHTVESSSIASAPMFATPTTADVNMDLLEKQYSEEFAPAYLQQFLKSNDRDNVYLKLTNQSPLVCFVELGNQSNLSLVLAPLESQ